MLETIKDTVTWHRDEHEDIPMELCPTCAPKIGKAHLAVAHSKAIKQAHAAGLAVGKEGGEVIARCYFEIAEELIGAEEVRRRFREKFESALEQPDA